MIPTRQSQTDDSHDHGRPAPACQESLTDLAPATDAAALTRDPAAPAVLDLFANTGDAVIGVDADLRVVLANPAARQLLGDDATPMIGLSCYEVFECGAGRDGSCWLFDLANAGQPISQHVMPVRVRGGRRDWVAISTIVVAGRHAASPHLVHLFRLSQPAALPAHRPAALEVFCLGDFRVARHGQPLDETHDWGRKKVRSVFKYLLTHRRRWVSRDELVDVFWPDLEPRAAHHNLRVTLSALRRVLEPELAAGDPSRYLLARDDMLRFADDSGAWLDVVAFEGVVRQATAAPLMLSDDALARLEEAVELYRGDYLPAELYEDWATDERQRVLDCYAGALRRLAREYRDRGQTDRALTCWHHLARLNPADEEARRALMAALAGAGQRAEALHQYQLLTTFLRHELQVAPLPETTRLYQAILAGRTP